MKVNTRVSALAAVAAALSGGSVMAQDTYVFTLDQPNSTIESLFSATAPFDGSFIGNFDAESNPDGTRTLLGALGFCTPGNQRVNFTGSGGASGSPTTNPSGSFTLRIDTATNRAVLHALSLDLLGGAQPSVTATATMNYQAFRTCNPTGFFPSIEFPFEFGEAQITRMATALACAPAFGTIKEINPGEYTFSVPATVSIDPGITLNGVEQETSSVITPVVLVGTVRLGDVAASASARLAVEFDQTVEGPFEVADDQPFDLPNPLGGTVHLLLDLTMASVTFELGVEADVRANGSVIATPCIGDWNSSGEVNSQDFFDFLTSFFAGAADFNCSSTTDSQDFFDFLSAFFAGC